MYIFCNKFLKVFSFCILVLFVFTSFIFAQDGNDDPSDEKPYELDPVVVSASRIPSLLSELGQSIEIISAEQIKEIPVNSVDEILKFVAGLDVRQRGVAGVQSDVSIRGGSFEQTLILIDGMAMSDPQSGHQNMNLPINLDDIERIEIIKGASSRVYGPNAMAGIINIVTKEEKSFAVRAYGKYGSYNLQNFGVGVPFHLLGTDHKISFDHKSSDGYIGHHLNDFKTTTMRYGLSWEPFEGWKFRLGAGLTDKDFGAYKYYFESIPEQREKTKTIHGYGNFSYDDKQFYLHQKSYYRKGEDIFSYPVGGSEGGIQENHHKTQVYGGQIDVGFFTPAGKTNFGINYANEDIRSNSLGNDERYRVGFTIEHRVNFFNRINIGVGITSLKYEKYGSDIWPGFDFTWNIFENVEFHGSIDKGFRIPSFTELYYSDPGNVGNSDLKAEEIIHYEIGLRLRSQGINFNMAAFYKDGTNILDWVKTDNGSYYAQNFPNIKFSGIEGGGEIFPDLNLILIRWNSAFINYTFLQSDLDEKGRDSKYVLNNFKHQLNAGVTLHYLKYFYHWASVKLNKRVDDDPYMVIDSRLGAKIGMFDIYAEVTNLLDVKYYEAGFAPMPGRWLSLGMQINFKSDE